MRARRYRAFTLVELLVVISIIALLISILLPSLKKARQQAKALRCGALIHGFGRGLMTYNVENDEWIPGRNTTGLETWTANAPGGLANLSRAHVPVQTYDWMTPALRSTTTLPADRAQRFRVLLETYRCPSVDFKAPLYSGSVPVDNSRFLEDIARHGVFYGISYLMPVHFQYWGQQEPKNVVGFHSNFPTLLPFPVARNPNWWEVRVDRYRSRFDEVGTPAEKIAVADGTRYLDAQNRLDFDHHPTPQYFGSFTSAGGWWRESVAYGPLSVSRGKNLPLSYRHFNGIEALFFDGHVERLSQRQSRKIDYWYPRGGVVTQPGAGVRDFASYPDGYVIR